MASSSAATPDTPITLKISYVGNTRRFKLPLRELGAASLEDKVSFELANNLHFEGVCSTRFIFLDASTLYYYKRSEANQHGRFEDSCTSRQEQKLLLSVTRTLPLHTLSSIRRTLLYTSNYSELQRQSRS